MSFRDFLYRAYVAPITRPIETAERHAKVGFVACVIECAISATCLFLLLMWHEWLWSLLVAASLPSDVFAVKFAWDEDNDDDDGGPWAWIG